MTPSLEDLEQARREIEQLRREVAELRTRTGNLPTNWPVAGGALPPGGTIYQVLSKVDNSGTVEWDYPRFNTGN